MSLTTKINHVAFIVDGNRRWAKARGLPSFEGHHQGFSLVKELIQAGLDYGIPHLTFFLFSTENWNRNDKEVSFLMSLAEEIIREELPGLKERGIRLVHLGRKDRLPSTLLSLIREAEELTQREGKMHLNLAVDFGGRDEIVRAVKSIATRVKKGELDPDSINEELFYSYLDTHLSPPVDLLIRTSGELRISDFLLYESAYSELYFSPLYFPDFTEEEFKKVLTDYKKRERRFGR